MSKISRPAAGTAGQGSKSERSCTKLPKKSTPSPSGQDQTLLSSPGDVAMANRIASRMVEDAYYAGKRKMYFCVLCDERPLTFPFDWRRKNIRGVSFPLTARGGAEAWVARALLAGVTVFHARSRRYGDITTGRGLEDGDDRMMEDRRPKSRSSRAQNLRRQFG